MPRVFSQPFCVVGALIEKDDKIALIQELVNSGEPDAGKWSHPAGWLEIGENPIVGAKREVKEETGFTFTPTAILGIYSLVRKDIEKERRAVPHPVKIIFIGDIVIDKQKDFHNEVSDLKWFTPEEIYTMDVSVLHDLDIKQMVKDYFDGKRYPLDLIHHIIQSKNSPK